MMIMMATIMLVLVMTMMMMMIMMILSFCSFNNCHDFTFFDCSNYCYNWTFVLCDNLGDLSYVVISKIGYNSLYNILLLSIQHLLSKLGMLILYIHILLRLNI